MSEGWNEQSPRPMAKSGTQHYLLKVSGVASYDSGATAAANQEATDQNGANPDHGQLSDVRSCEGQTARTAHGARRARGAPCRRCRCRSREGKSSCRGRRRIPRNRRGRHAASRLLQGLGLHAGGRTRGTRRHGQSGHCESRTHHQSPYPHHDFLFLAGCTRVPLPAPNSPMQAPAASSHHAG